LETAERDARASERLDQCAGGDAWQIGFQDGYESAILSAVQRVEALLQIDHTGTPWLPDDVPAVIAAIKGDQ
jgi:hypothetical protein